MPDPIHILAWLLLAVIAVNLIVRLLLFGVPFLHNEWRYYRTRSTPPAAGQRWTRGGGKIVEIKYVHPRSGGVAWKRMISDGGNIIETGGSDTAEEWRQRVRDNRWYLDWEEKHGRS